MTAKEVFDIITSEHKWYVSVRTMSGRRYSKSTAAKFKSRFLDGSVSMKQICHVFGQCGYFASEISWNKKPTG